MYCWLGDRPMLAFVCIVILLAFLYGFLYLCVKSVLGSGKSLLGLLILCVVFFVFAEYGLSQAFIQSRPQ